MSRSYCLAWIGRAASGGGAYTPPLLSLSGSIRLRHSLTTNLKAAGTTKGSTSTWPLPSLGLLEPTPPPLSFCRHFTAGQKDPRYYEKLGLTRKATLVEIKAAYFKLVKEYHPDYNKSSGASAKFNEVAEAYEVLGNARLKRFYDKEMYTVLQNQRQKKGMDVGKTDFMDTKHDEERKQKWRNAGTKRQPMQGRSEFFDYDQWTNQHYSDSFRRRMKAKEIHNIKHDMRRESGKFDAKMALTAMVGGVVFGIAMLLSFLFRALSDLPSSSMAATITAQTVDGEKRKRMMLEEAMKKERDR